MSISTFPPEVLENVFIFLDGITFCLSRQVCKAWNEVIKRMQLQQMVWRQFCLREISRNVLQEILEFKSVLCVTDTNWMSVYKKWFNSRRVLRLPYCKKSFRVPHEYPITCVRLSGSWVITGHSNGLLCVWNVMNGARHQNFMCHLKIINDIALVDLLNLGSYYGSEEALPWSHHHMITISKDRYIHILSLLEPMIFTDSDIHINYHTDDLKQIRVFGDIFAVHCLDNTVSLWKMKIVKKPHFELKVSFLQNIIGPADYILSIGFWQDEVQCVTHSGKLKVTCANEREWTEKYHLQKSHMGGDTDNIISVTAAFLYRQETVILLTSDGRMAISVGGSSNNCSRQHHLMQSLQTSVVSVALHGSILALGGENGKLFMFHTEREEDIVRLDFSRPNITLPLSEASIISVSVSHLDDVPVIVACTTESVHIIRWYECHTAHQTLRRKKLSFPPPS